MLAVGDSTTLEIIFSTKRYRGDSRKRPKIQTNEGPPDKFVTIIANIVQRPDSTYPIVINPYKIDMSQFTDKVIKKAKFKITNVSDQKLKLTMVALPEGLMKIKLPKSIDPGKTVEAEVKLHKDILGESFHKSFTFEMDDADKSRFTVPIKRTVKNMTKKAGKKAGKLTGK
ncbi:MAG: DUF1573 domain-containing protein [candidate division Zixibacteria bacterium]|nr:DUF1573 domain-containing protein [candidate division Zixibacteria bacterium]